VRHEYSLLLAKRFSIIPAIDQQTVLDLIAQGPDKLNYIRSMTNDRGQAPSQELIDSYVKQWTLEWLSFIEDDLPEDWKQKYATLRQEVGEPSHPEFPYYTSSGHGFQSGSNLSLEDLNEISVTKIVEELMILADHEISSKQLPPSEAIEKLHSFVRVNPESIAVYLDDLLRLPPKYLADVVGTLSMSLRGAADQDVVSSLLALCSRLITDLEGNDIDDNGSILNALANALDRILSDAPKPIEPSRLGQLQQIAERLLPQVKFRQSDDLESSSKDFDPLFSAINGLNGRIIGASITIALLQKQAKAAHQGDDFTWLFSMLDQFLVTMPPEEVEIPALLGYRFPWLTNISKEWSQDNVEGIFPSSGEFRWRWEAAWCTYISHSAPYNDLLGILEQQYRKAALELSASHC
jgi:hypothetical protein